MDGEAQPPSYSALERELSNAGFANALYPGGDIPFPEEELAREQNESVLTTKEREDKAFSCLLLAQRHMEAHGDQFKQAVRLKSPQLGMREDDVVASLLHSMWASCFNKSISVETSSLLSLPVEEVEHLLTPGSTEARFSQQMTRQLDEAIRRHAVQDPLYSPLLPPLVFVFAFIFSGILVFFIRRVFRGGEFPVKNDEEPTEAAMNSANESLCKEETPQDGSARKRVSDKLTRGPQLGAPRGRPLRAS